MSTTVFTREIKQELLKITINRFTSFVINNESDINAKHEYAKHK